MFSFAAFGSFAIGALLPAPLSMETPWPNKLPAVDAAIALLLAFAHPMRGTTDAERSATLHANK
jgi:hypothetical protein